jgi:hypothetical protein
MRPPSAARDLCWNPQNLIFSIWLQLLYTVSTQFVPSQVFRQSHDRLRLVQR